MAISHSGGEAKFVKCISGLFALHSSGITALNRVVTFTLLVKGNFGDNTVAKLRKNFLSALVDVIVSLDRLSLDLLLNLSALIRLSLGKVSYCLDVTTADINEPKMLHLNHESAMDSEVILEMRLQHEQFFLQGVLGFVTVALLDGFLPHAHKLPLLKLLEEAEFLDMVVRITLDKPLPKRDKLNRNVVLVECESLARESVVPVFVALTVTDNSEVVGISIILRVQVHEHGFFLTLRIQKQLNVLVQVAPFLGKLGLVFLLTFLTGKHLRLNIGHLFSPTLARGRHAGLTVSIVKGRQFSTAKFFRELAS
jgi:hypothetical protein